MTINRFCSSGPQRRVDRRDRIRTGEADSHDRRRHREHEHDPADGPPRAHADVFAHDETWASPTAWDLTAEKVRRAVESLRARRRTAFALSSHQKALAAQARASSTPRSARGRRGREFAETSLRTRSHAEKIVKRDEGPRADTSSRRPREAAAGVRGEGDRSPPGNSSQTSDGAGASILVSERVLKELALAPLARWVGFAVAACPPESWASARSRRFPRSSRRPASARSSSTGSS
jgi:acetyl-CoA acyltransferase